MTQALWQPSPSRIAASNMQRFAREKFPAYRGEGLDYPALHAWSVAEPEAFWQAVFDFSDIKVQTPAHSVLDNAEQFPGARWFSGCELNFAENLLARCDDKVALVSYLENGERSETTYQQLCEQVAQLAAWLNSQGVVAGDRVVGFMPNVSQTVVAMLAATSLGAVWSSCSPDFGINGVLDRFGQIAPKVMFACDGYYYNGKIIDSRERVQHICEQIDSLQQVVLVSVANTGEIGFDKVSYWPTLFGGEVPPLSFTPVAFDHPLYVMYSSGTTGKPKCIVHGTGGTLLQHRKEHMLHADLTADDVIFYFTTCGWMMWNWLVSSLASGATLVLYDGSPFAPKPEVLLDIAEREGISIFGTSAKYIAALEKAGLCPRESHDLSALKAILSTGSPLSHESFQYVYRDIKADVCLSSISGGTDIISCFVLGNPCLPVYEGEIQCAGLGMAVEFWDDAGKPLQTGKGEMVCTQPFPSAPIGFWNDDDGSKYRGAYFDSYPNIWVHGDYGEYTENGGVIIHGRADAVLNPGGVRIGTAEIYRQVEKLPEIQESICIGQEWQDDVRVVLFVVMQPGHEFNDELQARIKQQIRSETTPRHVPAKILPVTEIPRTISGKIVELAVRNVVHGKPVNNTDALANPQALDNFRDLPELQV